MNNTEAKIIIYKQWDQIWLNFASLANKYGYLFYGKNFELTLPILCVIGTIFIAFNGEILNKSYGQMGIYKQTGTFLVCFEDDFFEKVWSRYRYTLFVMKVKQKMTYYCVKRM